MKKTAIATIIAGLSIGTAKLIYDHRHTINKHANLKGNNEKKLAKLYDNIRNTSGRSIKMNALRKLPDNNQAQVLQVVSAIIPQSDNDDLSGIHFQIHADEYRRLLKYLTPRWACRSKNIAKDLHISLRRAKNLKYALIKQGLLEHTDGGNNYVLRPTVGRLRATLRPYYHKGVVASPKAYMRILRNAVATEMFD